MLECMKNNLYHILGYFWINENDWNEFTIVAVKSPTSLEI